MMDIVCGQNSPKGDSNVPMDIDKTQLASEFQNRIDATEMSRQLRDAWVEFLTKIGGWVFDRLEFEMLAGDDHYQPPSFEDTFVHRFTELHTLSEDRGEHRFDDWTQPQPGVLNLRYPLDRDMRFRAKVLVLPKPNMEAVPVFLYDRYRIGVLNLARANLYSLPGRDWTDNRAAASLMNRVDATIRQARAHLRETAEPPELHEQITPLGMLSAERYAMVRDRHKREPDIYERPGYYNGQYRTDHLGDDY